VSPGETIDTIAFQEYGDPNQWRRIADYNRLDNPLRLRAGQKLAIPPLA
ncbi:MAG TPA: LysM domain-containing protein, partial [Chloroflexota bacterium]|nr:LysM domain-containing protein [Chloroflexota bacterium]